MNKPIDNIELMHEITRRTPAIGGRVKTAGGTIKSLQLKKAVSPGSGTNYL